MDSLTHIALGACIGEAFFEKGFGKKAMIWGALAQSIPDIDFLAATWLSPVDNLLAHRGFTHSLLFAVLVAPFFALIAEKVHRPHNISFRKWLYFFAIEVFLHLFLDAFNNYGVGWFEPFAHQRISFNTIYVADPFFSIWAGLALVMLIALNAHNRYRKFWWRLGIFAPMLYLSYCCFNKYKAEQEVKGILLTNHIPAERILTTPAPFQSWLWFVVAGNDSGYYVGYHSVFDHPGNLDLRYFRRNDSLALQSGMKEEIRKLKRFSQQFYTMEHWNDTLVFNDLRFGQISGWEDPENKFSFHYFLKEGADNTLVVQRGRFMGWNRKTLAVFWKRIRGN